MAALRRKRARDYHQPMQVYLRYGKYAAIALLVVLTAIAFIGQNSANRRLADSREIMAASIQSSVNEALRSFDGFERKSIDLPSIFEQIRRNLYAAEAMNRSLVKIHGEQYSVFDAQALADFELIMDEYSDVLATGRSADEVRGKLSAYMSGTETSLAARFGSDGGLLPKTALQTP